MHVYLNATMAESWVWNNVSPPAAVPGVSHAVREGVPQVP